MSTIDFQLNCACCGAALHGLRVQDACAQCGQPVGDTISLASLDPVDMSVCIDLSCVGCDYNVRTLRFNAVCPECFKPVIESLRPDELRFATTKWLRRVRGGVTLLLVAAIGIVAVYFWVFAFTIFWAGPVGGPWGSPVAKVLCSVLLLVLVGWGIFAATTSDPYPRVERPSNTARHLARFSLVLTLPPFLLASTSSAGWPVWINVVAPFMYLFLPVSPVCSLVCVRRLARRARRPRLARLTSVLIWLFVGGGAGGLGTGVFVTFSRQSMVVRTPAATAVVTSSATSPATVTAPDSTDASAAGAAAAGGTGSTGSTGSTGGADVAPAPPVPSTVGPPGYIATTVTVAPGGTVTTTTATVGPGVAPVVVMPNRGVMVLAGLVSCGMVILFAGCYVIGLIVLIKYRNLLGNSIAAAATV